MYKVINPPPGAAYLHFRFLCTQIYSSPYFSSFFFGNNETVGPFWVLKYHILFLTIWIIFHGKQDMTNSENHSSRNCFRVPFDNHPICDTQRKETHLTVMMAEPGKPGSLCHVLPTCLHTSSVHLFKCGQQLGSVSTRSTGRPLWPSGALTWKPLCYEEVKLITPYDKWTISWQCLGTVHRIKYTFFQMHT